MAGPSSPYGRLSEIVESDLPSFLSFHSAGDGMWAVAGCRDDVVRFAYFGQRSGQHIRIGYGGHPDVIWRSSRCDVCECRVLLLEGVRIGEARHVSSWGNPDETDPDRNLCHVSSRGGVPTLMTLTRRFTTSHQTKKRNLVRRVVFTKDNNLT